MSSGKTLREPRCGWVGLGICDGRRQGNKAHPPLVKAEICVSPLRVKSGFTKSPQHIGFTVAGQFQLLSEMPIIRER